MGRIRLLVWSKLGKSSPLSFKLNLHSYNDQQGPRCLALVLSGLIYYSWHQHHVLGSSNTNPPTFGFLQWLFPQARMLFPQISAWPVSSPCQVFAQIPLPKSHLWKAYLKLQCPHALDSEAPLIFFSCFHSTYYPLEHNIIYFYVYCFLFLVWFSCWNKSTTRAGILFCFSLMDPKCLEQFPGYRRTLINTCWMNGFYAH